MSFSSKGSNSDKMRRLFHLRQRLPNRFKVIAKSNLAGQAAFVQNRFERNVIPLILDIAILSCLPVIVAHAGG